MKTLNSELFRLGGWLCSQNCHRSLNEYLLLSGLAFPTLNSQTVLPVLRASLQYLNAHVTRSGYQNHLTCISVISKSVGAFKKIFLKGSLNSKYPWVTPELVVFLNSSESFCFPGMLKELHRLKIPSITISDLDSFFDLSLYVVPTNVESEKVNSLYRKLLLEITTRKSYYLA